MEEFVGEFLLESYDNLEQAEKDLEALRRDPSDRDALQRLFRALHSIKGMCGFFGFSRLGSVSHMGENLLAALRDGRAPFQPPVGEVLVDLLSTIREILERIEQEGTEGSADDSELLGRLDRARRGKPIPLPAPQAEAEELPPLRLGDILIRRGLIRPEDVGHAVARQRAGDPRRLGEILVAQGLVQPQQILEALLSQEEQAALRAGGERVRVEAGLLRRLGELCHRLAGEHDRLLRCASTRGDSALEDLARRLSPLVGEIRELVDRARQEPVETLWCGLPHLAEELAHSCGKRIRVRTEGGEVLVDRAVIEGIRDPLTHLVRNSIDHGIEPPDERSARGKPPEGTLVLRARREKAQVVMEVVDDGAGIDVERIKEKLLYHGLITPDLARKLSDREAANLVFLPGFSTARKVTSLSGRGVGMDVVRSRVARLGGTVEVETERGRGTLFRLRLPEPAGP